MNALNTSATFAVYSESGTLMGSETVLETAPAVGLVAGFTIWRASGSSGGLSMYFDWVGLAFGQAIVR